MDIEYCRQYEPFWGSWYITKLLGEGGYGSVFEIEKKEFDHTYKAALKAISVPPNQSDVHEMKSDGMDDESVTTYYREVVKDMMREFTIMSEMKGESNIVSIEDVSTCEKKNEIGWDIFVRMELLTPVGKYFEENHPEEKDIVRMGIDVCKALELCESHNILHRDIKPANIFVSTSGHFKLGDFGVSKIVERNTGASTKVGTIGYMAPEVYRGGKYGNTVDLYSLGLVLYRFLNHGRLPFLPDFPNQITPQDKENARMRRVKGDPLPPLGINNKLMSIIQKACSKDPFIRYQNASDMRKELETVYNSIQNKNTGSISRDYLHEEKTLPIAPKQVNNMPQTAEEKTLPITPRPVNTASQTVEDKTLPITPKPANNVSQTAEEKTLSITPRPVNNASQAAEEKTLPVMPQPVMNQPQHISNQENVIQNPVSTQQQNSGFISDASLVTTDQKSASKRKLGIALGAVAAIVAVMVLIGIVAGVMF
jgi:serine/threonine protein kinase